MEYQDFFGQLAMYSFLGVLLSIAITCYQESRKRNSIVPKRNVFWDRLALYTWVVVFAFGASITIWTLISVVGWFGRLNE